MTGAELTRGDLHPPHPGESQVLLDGFLLQKAVYELGYELDHRPGWAAIPIRGILQLLEVTD